MAEISYLPGEGTAIVAGDAVLLVDAPADAQVCAALWRVAASGAGYERLRAVIESYGPARLPALGLIGSTGEGVLVLLRGATQASIRDDVSMEAYTDDGGRLYVEYGPLAASEVRLWLREPAQQARLLPLVAGVVRSDAVMCVLAGTQPPRRAPTQPPVPEQAPPATSAPSLPPRAAPPAPMDGVFVERATASTPTPMPAPAPSFADVWVTHTDPDPGHTPPPTAAPPGTPGLRPSPAVRATLCPNSHPNPPDAPICRLCGAAIIDRELSIVARPPLGRLDFAALGWVPLDRDILIGSDPGEQPSDGPRPVLIAHPAVSPQHIEVRVHDWTVAIVDLDSRNGTSLVLPGRTAQPLRGRYPAPIVPGTVVWLAQQLPFTYVAA